MLLPFTDSLMVTSHYDDEMRQLADRHYSRRTPGARQFCYSGRKLVLRDPLGAVLFVWMYPDSGLRMDGRVGYNCAIFRNESPRRSSEIILEAERFAVEKWGSGPAYTFVDSREIRSTQPGYCFLMAGWDYQRDAQGKPLLTTKGKHILQKLLATSSRVAQAE
jgi:hypothetical protein